VHRVAARCAKGLPLLWKRWRESNHRDGARRHLLSIGSHPQVAEHRLAGRRVGGRILMVALLDGILSTRSSRKPKSSPFYCPKTNDWILVMTDWCYLVSD